MTGSGGKISLKREYEALGDAVNSEYVGLSK